LYAFFITPCLLPVCPVHVILHSTSLSKIYFNILPLMPRLPSDKSKLCVHILFHRYVLYVLPVLPASI
jgi:hypothetical protein